MNTKKRSPWFWVPSLYFAEGIPYVIVMMVSVIMYKRLGVSNTDIALYTSWLYLPWVIKPFWSPIVDIFRTKRFWIIAMQLVVGAGLAGVAFTIPLPGFFQMTLAFMWLLAFSSATHDIAADGFYMLGLDQHEQAWYVGIRSTFYRFAMITGQGLLIILAGFIETNSGLPDIDIEVTAAPGIQQAVFASPDSIVFNEENGAIHFITVPKQPAIAAHPIARQKADSLKSWAKEWNTTHGFTKSEIVLSAEEAKANESTWHAYITKPLEKILHKYFGAELKAPSEKEGNIGLVFIRLSAEPQDDQNIVLNFGYHSGDKSIALMEGQRLEFNRTNWKTPAATLIQLDPKLHSSSSAVFKGRAGNIPLAWSITFFFLTVMFIAFFIYHKIILPYPVSDKPAPTEGFKTVLKEFAETFMLFFKKERIGLILAFLLLYRLAESQLVKLASPFLLDAQELGGMALTTGEVGFIYGTVGILFLTIGGLLGGFLAAKNGLKYWIWIMALAINIPDVVYVYLSYAQPDNFWIINACVAAEQFGYGFGFTAYMLFMIFVSEGKYKTAHFAIATGFMALGMMIPGMFSGWLQEIIGYQHFFIWVMIATIPGFLIIPFIPLDKTFGMKKDE